MPTSPSSAELLLEPAAACCAGQAAAGQIGEDVDLLAVQVALAQELHGLVERHRQRLRVGHGLQARDSLLGRAAIGLKRRRRAQPRVQHGDLALLRAVAAAATGPTRRAASSRVWFSWRYSIRGAASNTSAAATGASWLPTRPAPISARPGQGERQQRNGPRPQQQQQQVPQLQPPLVRVVPASG